MEYFLLFWWFTWPGSPAVLGTFIAVADGVVEEARTRGFASLAFAKFAFIGCTFALCADRSTASIRSCT